MTDNKPVEIKIKYNGDINDVIRTYYHQLQFIIHCAKTDSLILCIYFVDKGFSVVEVLRDENFIQICLPKLEYTFYQHLFRYEDTISKADIETLNGEYHIFRQINTIKTPPLKLIAKKNVKYFEKTEKFLSYIDTSVIDESRYRYVEERVMCCNKGEWTLSKGHTKGIIKKEKHRQEAQVFIDILLRLYEENLQSIQYKNIN